MCNILYKHIYCQVLARYKWAIKKSLIKLALSCGQGLWKQKAVIQGMGRHQEGVLGTREVSLPGQKMQRVKQTGYISKSGTTQHNAHINEFWKPLHLTPKPYTF